MSSDLIFPIIPREGKVPIAQEEQRVQEVAKEAILRELSDEEKELKSEERETREKFQKKNQKKKRIVKKAAKKAELGEGVTVDEHGRKHLDIYV